MEMNITQFIILIDANFCWNFMMVFWNWKVQWLYIFLIDFSLETTSCLDDRWGKWLRLPNLDMFLYLFVWIINGKFL
jgi:hypothetical protein